MREQTVCMRFPLDGCLVTDKVDHQSRPHGNPWGILLLLSKIQPLKNKTLISILVCLCLDHSSGVWVIL